METHNTRTNLALQQNWAECLIARPDPIFSVFQLGKRQDLTLFFPSADKGFSATVWRGKVGTDYSGQVYLSMRGSAQFEDFVDDAQLAATGVAYDQIKDMVNWWLRATTPATEMAQQIQSVDIGISTPINTFIAATPIAGTSELTGANAIGNITSINGHSLGGYLATAFERIFGGSTTAGKTIVNQVETFNSAGFSNLMISNINNEFNHISQALFGTDAKDFNQEIQTSFYGENGFEVTTNEWRPKHLTDKEQAA